MDNSRIFLTADTHFCHKNIIKYCNRPFSSVEEMNEILIQNWNSCVKKNDRIFVLGDFCLGGKDKVIEIGKRLNGRKTLILGNHDSCALKTYYEAGFEAVSKYPLFVYNYLLSHEPIKPIKDTFGSTQLFNIHGHLHGKPVSELEGDYGELEWFVDVGVDSTDFKPILFEIK